MLAPKYRESCDASAMPRAGGLDHLMGYVGVRIGITCGVSVSGESAESHTYVTHMHTHTVGSNSVDKEAEGSVSRESDCATTAGMAG
jgi:hypothetical protein